MSVADLGTEPVFLIFLPKACSRKLKKFVLKKWGEKVIQKYNITIAWYYDAN